MKNRKPFNKLLLLLGLTLVIFIVIVGIFIIFHSDVATTALPWTMLIILLLIVWIVEYMICLRKTSFPSLFPGLSVDARMKMAGILLLICFGTFWFDRQIKGIEPVEHGLKMFAWGIHLVACFSVILFGVILIRGKHSVEKQFLIVAGPVSLCLMMAITPYSAPDESHHYFSSYQLSNYLMLQWDDTDRGDAQDFDSRDLPLHWNTSSGYQRFLNEIGSKRKSKTDTEIPYPRVLTYPLMYLPQALGIAIGRLTGLNFFVVFYFGRLFNLAFYLMCCYFAIKIIPKKKHLMFAICLMPMALHQAISYSYDGFVNAISFLFIALVVRAIFQESRITGKEIVMLLITGILLASAKVGYVVLEACLFLIPVKRFRPRKQYLYVNVGIVAASILCIIMFWIPSLATGSAINYRSVELYSLSYIYSHPLGLIDIIISTIKSSGVFFVNCAIGQLLSGLTLELPLYISYCYLIVLMMLAMRRKDDPLKCITFNQRTVLLLCSLAGVLLSFLTLLTTWTEYGAQTIGGLQGRYFIPLFPLMFMALENNWITRDKRLEEPLLLLCVILNSLVVDNVLTYTLQH